VGLENFDFSLHVLGAKAPSCAPWPHASPFSEKFPPFFGGLESEIAKWSACSSLCTSRMSNPTKEPAQSQQPPFLAEKPANLHQRLTTAADDEEYDPLVEGLGDCKKLYAQLEVGPRASACSSASHSIIRVTLGLSVEWLKVCHIARPPVSPGCGRSCRPACNCRSLHL
jgi:hypothetical protein